MKKLYSIVFCTLFLLSCSTAHSNYKSESAQWVIVGAGPAGISVVGLLLDYGVPAQDITWIDPEFKVGRLGQYYANVPSNTQTKYFVEFIQSCKTFLECNSPALEHLLQCNPEQEYTLKTIVDPLQDITNYICTQVHVIKESLESINYNDELWEVGTKNHHIMARNVVLATGSRPRTLDYDCQATIIPLDNALDKNILAQHVNAEDSIAVVGSAHSAILILKYLSELNVARIINFYTKKITYALENSGGSVDEINGLKGIAARWAQEVLETNPPANLMRIINSPEARKAWMPVCNKIIYAIGFERNDLPAINGDTSCYNHYDGSSGIIAPRLFGIGIAFPEKITDHEGNQQLAIGLNEFIEYAQRLLPVWMKKKNCVPLNAFKNLFFITQL